MGDIAITKSKVDNSYRNLTLSHDIGSIDRDIDVGKPDPFSDFILIVLCRPIEFLRLTICAKNTIALPFGR